MSPLLSLVLCPMDGRTPLTSYRGRMVSRTVPLCQWEEKHQLLTSKLADEDVRMQFLCFFFFFISADSAAPWQFIAITFLSYAAPPTHTHTGSHSDPSMNDRHVQTRCTEWGLCTVPAGSAESDPECQREKRPKKKSGWEVWGSAVGAPLQPKLFSKAKATRPLFSLASLHDPHWQKTHRRRGGRKKDINTELRGQQYSEMKKRWVAWEWIGSKPPKSQTEGRAAGKPNPKKHKLPLVCHRTLHCVYQQQPVLSSDSSCVWILLLWFSLGPFLNRPS